MNGCVFRVFAVTENPKEKSKMKKTLITFIAVLLSLAGAHAQSKHVQTHLWRLDSLTLDSMYNHWYTYAQEHPQDEVAWRNVYDVYKCYEHYLVNQVAAVERLPKARKEMLQKMGFMEKMKQAIPDSYTYNICTFDIAHYYVHPTDNSYDVYLDRVIEKLPDYDDGYDYDPLVSIFVVRDDSIRLKKVLDLYFQSGFYPSEELQYNYNELQGMEEGAVYIASHDGNVNGKLILQHVLGVRPDVIIFNENNSYDKEYVNRVFQRIGIPINDSIWVHDIISSLGQKEKMKNILRYIFEHSQRPVYVSANNIKDMSNGWG